VSDTYLVRRCTFLCL